MAHEFLKYKNRGSYHWEMISRDIRKHHPFLAARYHICMEMLGCVRGRKVLDLGCGDGALAGLIAKAGGQVIGVDPSELGIELARKEFARRGLRGKFYITSEHVPDESCDVVVCTEVLEHVVDPEMLLKEIIRVLKPEGIAVISTPIRLTERPLDQEHIREYYPSEFEELCARYFHLLEIRQVIPLAAHELFYYRHGFLGLLLNLVLRVRSAWLGNNYMLNWKGFNRYFQLQVARVQKRQSPISNPPGA